MQIKCAARATRTLKVDVSNPSAQQQEFRVFSDMPCVSGPDSLALGGRQTATYAFKYTPTLSGTFTGALTFSSRSGHYVWYTLEAHVAAAPQVATLDVSCPGAQCLELPCVILPRDAVTVVCCACASPGPHRYIEGDVHVVGAATQIGNQRPKSATQVDVPSTTRSTHLCAVIHRTSRTVAVGHAVRCASEIQVGITNPLSEAITLDVLYGHPSLVGARTFALQPREAGTFTFYFAPLVVGAGDSTVKLQHPDVGEFWYQVRHEATPGSSGKAVQLACEIGASADVNVPFSNPMQQALRFAVRSSAPQAFQVKQKEVKLGANETRNVCVRYTPSSVGRPEHATLVFENEVCVLRNIILCSVASSAGIYRGRRRAEYC